MSSDTEIKKNNIGKTFLQIGAVFTVMMILSVFLLDSFMGQKLAEYYFKGYEEGRQSCIWMNSSDFFGNITQFGENQSQEDYYDDQT